MKAERCDGDACALERVADGPCGLDCVWGVAVQAERRGVDLEIDAVSCVDTPVAHDAHGSAGDAVGVPGLFDRLDHEIADEIRAPFVPRDATFVPYLSITISACARPSIRESRWGLEHGGTNAGPSPVLALRRSGRP
jgi:hypothetical protein